MRGITFSSKGEWKDTTNLLNKILLKKDYKKILKKYAEDGVNVLRKATPVDTGKTADSWTYEIVEEKGSISIYWKNSSVNNNVNIAILLQYGHSTGSGGYVKGRDYIKPAIRPIFDKICEDLWKEVKR